MRQLPADPVLRASPAAGDTSRHSLATVSQPSLFVTLRPAAGAVANVDGGSRGNPGPAGYGVRIERDDGTVVELKESLGIATNNVAEYRGLLAALRVGGGQRHRAAARPVRLGAAGQADARRLPREERRASAALRARRGALARQIGRVTFEHVRRELNKDADRLANEAMDAAE